MENIQISDHITKPQIFGNNTTGTFQQMEFWRMHHYRQKLGRAIEKSQRHQVQRNTMVCQASVSSKSYRIGSKKEHAIKHPLAYRVTMQIRAEAEPKRRRAVMSRQEKGQQKVGKVPVMKEGKESDGMIGIR